MPELPQGWRAWNVPHILTITVADDGQWTPTIICPGLDVGSCETHQPCNIPGCNDSFSEQELDYGIAHGRVHRYMECFDGMGTPMGECWLDGHEKLRDAVEYLLGHRPGPGSWLIHSNGDGGPGGLGLMALDYEPDRLTMHPRTVRARG